VSEFRRDALTNEWVLIVGQRQDRPNLPNDGCPFCVGGLEAPDAYDVRAFENRWPAMAPGVPPDLSGDAAPVVGAAEVVLYTPVHDGSLASIGAEAARHVVDLWAQRSAELSARPEVAYVLVFENRGASVGATISHPHGQIYAFPFVPPAARVEAEVAERDGCPLCTDIPAERAQSSRVVREESGWLTWVPFASGYPFGTLVAPHDHVASLADLDAPARDGLAAALVDIVGRYDRLFEGGLPYLMWIHPGVHLHLHFAPPRRAAGVDRYVASGEVGSGTLSNPVEPERAAEVLRAL
jgi:UDPglucose--hexose-1-phosphate uridylyltransferase